MNAPRSNKFLLKRVYLMDVNSISPRREHKFVNKQFQYVSIDVNTICLCYVYAFGDKFITFFFIFLSRKENFQQMLPCCESIFTSSRKFLLKIFFILMIFYLTEYERKTLCLYLILLGSCKSLEFINFENEYF